MKLNVPVGGFLVASVCVIAASFIAGSLAAAAPSPSASRPKARSAAAHPGATTSFHFSNIPVRSALQLIAEEGGFNLVVSDSVQGNISQRLNDVTWQQALEIVLRIKGLQQRVDRNTRSIAPARG